MQTSRKAIQRVGRPAAGVILVVATVLALSGCDGLAYGSLRSRIAEDSRPVVRSIRAGTDTLYDEFSASSSSGISPTADFTISFNRVLGPRDISLSEFAQHVTDETLANSHSGFLLYAEELPALIRSGTENVPVVFSYGRGETSGPDGAEYYAYFRVGLLAPLAPDTDYTLEVRFIGAEFPFRTSTRPYVTALSPHPGFFQMPYSSIDDAEQLTADTVFSVTFSTDMDAGTFTADSVKLYYSGSGSDTRIALATTVTYDAATRTATVTPLNPLDTAADSYELYLDDTIEDTGGGALHDLSLFWYPL